jgi:hypothetical protein
LHCYDVLAHLHCQHSCTECPFHWYSLFMFGRSQFQISTWMSGIVTGFCSFCLHWNTTPPLHTLCNLLFTIICSFDMAVTETYLNIPKINKWNMLVGIACVLYSFIHMCLFPFCLSLCLPLYIISSCN